MTERTRLFWLFLAGGLVIAGIAVAVPHTFQADTVISASQMNANFAALESRLAVVEAGGADVPAGTIVAFGGIYASIPAGWELCDGRALSQTDPKYTALFAAIGTVHGGAATTFNLPDYRGMFLRGVDRGRGKDPDAAARQAAAPGGHTDGQIGTVQGDALQSVSGQFTLRNSHTAGGAGVDLASSASGVFQRSSDGDGTGRVQHGTSTGAIQTVTFDVSRVARTATETRPVNAAVHYIIKL